MSTPEPNSLLTALDQLESLRKEKIGQRRRRCQRFVVRGEGLLEVPQLAATPSSLIAIQLRDVSLSGLGSVCLSTLEVGSQWRVLCLHRGFPIAYQGLIVRHCDAVDSNLHLLGGAFCADAGLLSILGVDPRAIPLDDAGNSAFMTPDDGA